jgi:nucleotide-binding universal stress UspA family protein
MKSFHHTRLFGHVDACARHTAAPRSDRSASAQGRTCEDPRPVLVAVDGSAADWDALDWAAAEAAARRCVLRLLHVFTWPMGVDSSGVVYARVGDAETVEAAEWVVADAVRHVRQVAPDIEVEAHLQAGAPASAICRESAEDALVVIGRDQPTGSFGVRRGARNQYVARQAGCPVAVVALSRTVCPGPSVARVVVGVDDPRDSSAVLGFAFRAARRRDVGVTVLHAWSPRAHPELDGFGDEPTSSEFTKRHHLDAALPRWMDAFPDVEVKQRLIRGPAGRALVVESASAALLVVGSRGRGPLRAALFGSVSRTVLRSAHCPVAVVREPVVAATLSGDGGMFR